MEILGCFGSIVILLAAVILNGWALSVMWGWFIIPVFNAPPLDIAPAIGLAMVVSFLTARRKTESRTKGEKGKWENLLTELAIAVLYPLMALAFGYVVQLFM